MYKPEGLISSLLRTINTTQANLQTALNHLDYEKKKSKIMLIKRLDQLNQKNKSNFVRSYKQPTIPIRKSKSKKSKKVYKKK